MVTAAVFNGIGNKFNIDMAKGGGNFWAAGVSGGARHIFMHAMAGGVLSVLQGGKFGHGFASAGLSKGFDANFNMESGDAGAFFAETVIVAVVGGTISEITGGKFANGAATSAFQHLFNEVLSHAQKQKARMAAWYAKHPVPSFGEVWSEEMPKWAGEFGQDTWCAMENMSCTLSVSVSSGLVKAITDGKYTGVKFDLMYSENGWSKDFGLGKVSSFNMSLTLDLDFRISELNFSKKS